MKKQNGITLIALVITIIVLLILAGVAIATLTGDNGLLQKTGEAKEKYNDSVIKEQIDLAKVNLKLENEEITATNIKDYLLEGSLYSESDIEITSKDENTSILKIGNISEELPKALSIAYFQKDAGWGNGDLYAYIWDNEKGIEYKSWPGEKLELIDGTRGIYKYQLPEIYYGKNIVFNNGSDAVQTVDLRMPGNNYIFKVQDPSQSRTVYYVTNSGKKVSIHMWKKQNDAVVATTQWPGEEMIFVKNFDNGDTFYRYEIPNEYDSFCFTELNEDNSVAHQTYDISYIGGDIKYYSIGQDYYKNFSATTYSDGVWEKYNK